MGEWREVRLQEITSAIGDGLHGTPVYSSEGEYYFINGNNLKNGEIIIDPNTKRCNASEFEKYKKPLGKRTILLSINGTIGNIAYYNSEKVFLGKSACYINVAEDVNKDFVRYTLQSPLFINYLEAFATGTTIKNVSLKSIRNFKIPLPNRREQDEIASILSSLDDKIELNRKMNETLEEMARAIFKSWFVDFDPVHAKARGEKPAGMPNEIADLFPSEFVHSDQLNKPIPKGWEVVPISKIYDVTIGKTPPRKEFQWFNQETSSIKWVSIRDLGNSNSFIFSTNETLTNEAIKKYNIKVVPAETVILSFKLTLGRVAITTDSMCTNEAIAHFQCNGGNPYTYFLYNYLKSFNYDLLGSTSSIATAVNSKIIKDMPLLKARNEIIDAFENTVNDLFHKIHLLEEEILNLTEVRDCLLPKLISGEIEV